jgi:hypothetical protein
MNVSRLNSTSHKISIAAALVLYDSCDYLRLNCTVMRLLLFLLLTFIALSAVFSGMFMLCYPDGSFLGLSTALLKDTAFHSFTIPGIILTVVVGGTSLVAVVLNVLAHPMRYNWAIAAGVVLAGWIVVQMLLINTFHWLQFVYLLLALMVLLLSWQLKGKWVV